MVTSISAPATFEGTVEVYSFVEQILEDHDVPPKTITHINIALDEAVSNVVRYAYDGGDGDYKVTVEVDEHLVRIEIRDRGFAYNPLETKDPDIHSPLEERKIGGYGIFMIKNLVSDVLYRRENDENVLTLLMKF